MCSMFCLINCHAKTELTSLKIHEGMVVYIDKTINLEGDTLVLPKDVTLYFSSNGCIKNGTIKGCNTYIQGKNKYIFDDISICGNWNVEYINTEMFCSLDRVDDIKNVIALTSAHINNVVMICNGEYVVSVDNKKQQALQIPSNTEVVLDGTIILKNNAFTHYYIIDLQGENIYIYGTGMVIGDKDSHIGSKGQWGMGINVRNGNNVRIYDITVKNCWGDCIYVGTNSENVYINNCVLDNGRRQGISVTSCKGITIDNCRIINVAGTAPEYGIDIEPNENELVDDVIIRNCTFINCRGGLICWGKAKNAYVGHVSVLNCYVDNKVSKYPYNYTTVDSLIMRNCVGDRLKVFVNDVNSSIFENNLIENSMSSQNFVFENCKPTSFVQL